MSSSSEDFRSEIESLLVHCKEKVLKELEEEVLLRLRNEGKRLLDQFFNDPFNYDPKPPTPLPIPEMPPTPIISVPAEEITPASMREPPLASPSEGILYAYGIVPERNFDWSDLRGLDHSTCYLIGHEGLGIVVSRLSQPDYNEEALHEHMEDLEWVEQHVHDHENVLIELMKKTTLIPLPFCTIFLDEHSVKNQLVEKKQLLEHELIRVNQRTEMMIKLFVQLDQLERKLKSSLPSELDEEGGGNYFRRLQREKQQTQKIESITETYGEKLLTELRQVCDEDRLLDREGIQPPEGLTLVFGAYFLVSKENQKLWEEALQKFDQEADEWHFLVDVTGPFPPYHFTSLKEEET